MEKSRRVIRVTPRGGQGKKHYAGCAVLSVLAVICLCYCIAIGSMMYGSSFYLVWGLLALFLAGWAFLLVKPHILKRIPKWLCRLTLGLVTIGVIFLTTLGTVIGTAGKAQAEPGADYVIVLGAQWRTTGPSPILRYRLEAALAYLEQNPDTCVIVTGAQGADEPISEAEGMAEYLQAAGIEESRIFVETQATNTQENLSYSSAFCDREQDSVLVVSNDFHIFRAVKIAEKQGYAKVSGLAANSQKVMLPHNILRECLAVVKEVLVGNI